MLPMPVTVAQAGPIMTVPVDALEIAVSGRAMPRRVPGNKVQLKPNQPNQPVQRTSSKKHQKIAFFHGSTFCDKFINF